MARYLIDSDVCIHVLRRQNESLKSLLNRIRSDGLAVSVISYGEVFEGILFSRQRALDERRWREFLLPIDIINVTPGIADVWANLRGTLRAEGRTLPDNDLLIAATAMYFDLTVVSGNPRHFRRVEGLNLKEVGAG